jgi:hypothetical protein
MDWITLYPLAKSLILLGQTGHRFWAKNRGVVPVKCPALRHFKGKIRQHVAKNTC